MSVPHKTPKKKEIGTLPQWDEEERREERELKKRSKPPPWMTKETCTRCGGLLAEGELDEDNTRCMSCNQDDADFIDSTMELD